MNTIVIKLKILTSLEERIKGLMFSKEIYPVFIKTRCGIHTFFLKEPIDIVVIDDKNIVRKIKYNLKPFRMTFWNPKCSGVLELPAGFIRKKKIKVGSEIVITK